MATSIVLIGLVIVFFVYFLPSFIGYHSRHFPALLVANIFLGWTFFGWVGRLIYVLVDHRNDR